jgi:hypothetical protein
MNRLLGIWLAGSLAIQASDLALVGARIYPAPDALPIKHGTVLIRDGRIVSAKSQMVFRNAISAFLSSAERSSPKA